MVENEKFSLHSSINSDQTENPFPGGFGGDIYYKCEDLDEIVWLLMI